MSWFTSRYTLNLEEQIADLKREKAELQAQVKEAERTISVLTQENVRLQLAAVRPLPPALADETPESKRAAVKSTGGWPQTLSMLESAETISYPEN